MRIDLDAKTPEATQPGKSSKSGSRAPADASSRAGSEDDQALLSLDRGKVQALEAKVMSAPEIRQERVEALRNQIQSGTYQAPPEQTAEAMLSEMAAQSAVMR